MAFRGLIATIPVGQQGFNGSKNASKLGPGHFSFVEGVDIDGGVLVKDGGAAKLNAVSMGAVTVMSGINWSPVPGNNDDIVFLSNGQMRKDTGLGTFPTLLTTVGSPTLFPPFFVKGGGESNGQPRKLFMFNEASQVQVILGTANTAADIPFPPADWATSFPIFGVQHDLRIWAGGSADDPHRIYYSTRGDHGNYIGRDTSGAATPPYVDTSGSISVFPGEGDQLVGGISFRGLLILFKYPNGIYMVDTRDPDITNWRVDRLNEAVGACSPWCIVQISNDVLVLDNTGHFHVMSTVTDFSDMNTSDISGPQQIGPFMRENVNLLGLRKAVGAWYAAKEKAWFMVPLAGATENNLRILVDFTDSKMGVRFLLFRRDVGASLWMRPDAAGTRKPTLGDDEGFVWLMDEDERNKEGVAYQMLMETSETDFSFLDPELAPRTKNGQYIEIVSDLVRNSTLNITPSWDGYISDPIVMNLGSAAAALGSFVLDVDVLSASGTVTAKHNLVGQGRRLKLTIENNELDDEVRLSEVRVGFSIADERLRYE